MQDTSKFTRRRDKDAGFSLVELMVVVFIMGLLASIGFVLLQPSREQAKVTRVMADINNFKTALEMYSADIGSYPTSEQGLDALVTLPSGQAAAYRREKGYVVRLPIDPWKRTYFYEYPAQRATGDYYDVYSAGPDGEPGTEDDIGNWS